MGDSKSTFTEKEEDELQIQQSAGIISFFLATQFNKYLFDSYMHAYIHDIKKKAYSPDFKATHSAREVALTRKKAKAMIKVFNEFNHSATELVKIFSLNKAIHEPFQKNSDKLFKDLESRFKRSLILYVNQLAGEFVLPNSPEEIVKRHRDLKL